MSPGPHGPGELRAFIRRLRGQRGDPQPLLAAAKAIGDHARAAQALAALAAHEQASSRLREEAIRKGAERLDQVTRELQVAEVAPSILKMLAAAGQARHGRPFVDRLVRLPNGEALSIGIREAAKHVPDPLRVVLFDRALQNAGYERDDAKAVLRSAFTSLEDLVVAKDWRARIHKIPDRELRIRLAAFLHHRLAEISPRHIVNTEVMQDVARDLEETIGQAGERERVDLWRAVVQAVASAAALAPLVQVLSKEPPEVRADVALALGAQADRLKDPENAQRLFDDVEALLPELGPGQADRIGRKLEIARGYLGGGSKPVERAPTPPRPTQARNRLERLPSSTGHSLALCNTYTGGISAAHFRAVARAAPLCAAFGLDLVLVGFPIPLGELVERTARETRIGGHAWVQDLADAGRVHALSLDPDEDGEAWRARGAWIATSERPDRERATSIEEAVLGGRICVLMGVGPKGLPDRVRRACAREYEITGAGVGLETATAMGILADRLARAARAQGGEGQAGKETSA